MFALRTQGLVANMPHNVEVAAHGQKFLVNAIVGDSNNVPLEVTLNWSEAHDPILSQEARDIYRRPLADLTVNILRQRDPTGSIYLWKDRRTVVEFTIDRQGELKDVHVTMSSGVEYLDHVALDAFRRAERFPNPPPGLFSPDGTVTMGFGFVLGLARGFRTRLGPAYLPNSPAQRGY